MDSATNNARIDGGVQSADRRAPVSAPAIRRLSAIGRRFLPSLTDVAFLMPLLFVFVKLDGARTLLGDGDTGWHLRTGEWMLANGRVPDRDIFSFTKAGQPWFAWEWLWDLAFGWMHREWGMAAVVLISLLLICITSALLYRLVLDKCGNAPVAMAATFLAVATSSIHWLARPHLFTLLFVVIFYRMLESVAAGRRRLLWMMPALMILWTNLHGGFFVGIVMIATYAAGELVSWLLAPNAGERRSALSRARPYALAAAACALVTLVNPYFYHLHVHIARYLTDSYHLDNISEFLPLSFRHPAARFLELMLAAAVLAAVWYAYRRRYVYTIQLLLWSHLGLIAARNVPILMMIAAPLVAELVAAALRALERADVAGWARRAAAELRSFTDDITSLERGPRVYAWCAASILLCALLLRHPALSERFRAEYNPKEYPAQATERLRSVLAGARVFASDVWGGYLIYRMYPDIRVYIDGRSDFYGKEIGNEMMNVRRGRYDWQEQLDKRAINVVLLPADAPLASVLKQSPRWRLEYDDGIAIMFQRSDRGRRTEPALSAGPAPAPASAAANGGIFRDRAITNVNRSDPRVTTSYARRTS